jgi:hypothetical protein
MRLGVFEEALAEMAIGWDDHVEAEVRRSLGKTPALIWTDEDGREHTVYLE